jgi:hypothetical protein
MKKLPSLENYTFCFFFCLLPASIQGMVAPHFIVILSWMNDDHCDFFFSLFFLILGCGGVGNYPQVISAKSGY